MHRQCKIQANAACIASMAGSLLACNPAHLVFLMFCLALCMQGMPRNGPAMLGPGPQGMMSSALGLPQRGPFSTPGSHPGAHPGSMPQGIVPINGSIQSPMHYMGYFPTPYFAAQSAGQDAQDTLICQLCLTMLVSRLLHSNIT